MKRYQINFIIGIVVSIACLYFAFHEVNFTDLKASLLRVKFHYIALALFLQLFQLLLKGIRWQALIAPFKHVPLPFMMQSYVVGLMLNDVMPAKAGELAKSYLVHHRENVPLPSILSTVAFERFLDVLLIMGLVAYLLSSGLFPHQLGDRDMLYYATVVGIIMAVGAVGLLVVWRYSEQLLGLIEQVGLRVSPRLTTLFLKPFRELLAGIDVSIYGWQLVKIVAATVLSWFFILLSTYFIFKALGVRTLTFHDAILVIVVTAFGMMVPSSPGYIGTYHWLAIETFKFRGCALTDAQALAILLHGSWFFLEVTLGAIFTVLLSVKYSEISKNE